MKPLFQKRIYIYIVLVLSLTVLIETGLLIGGYLYYQPLIKESKNMNTYPLKYTDKYLNNPKPSPKNTRSCIQGLITQTVDKNYFPGKAFVYMSASGKQGILQSDHKLPMSWGLDYAGPNDDRQSSGVGYWLIEDVRNITTLYLAEIGSHSSYSNFNFYEYKKEIFAVPIEDMSFIVGPNKESIENFYKERVKPCW